MRKFPHLIVLALLVAVAGSASAHAVLQSATPPPNGHADAGLQYVEVRFTEDVEHEYTSLDVVDLNGESHANGVIQFDKDHHDTVRLPVKPLGDGIFAVNWRTLSIDTHTARGSFVFAVGNATLRFAPSVEAHDHAEHSTNEIVKDGAARAAFYLGLFATLGAPLFGLVIDRERDLPRRLLAPAAALGLVGALGAGVMLLLFAKRTDLALAVAARTVAGASIVWRGLLLAGASALLFVAQGAPGRARRWLAMLAILAAGAAIVATALGSHAAADTEQRGLAVGMDAMHLLVGALWLGGVLAFLLVAWGRPARELGRIIARFTPMAVASVILIAATGTYASLRHIPAWSDLWTTGYGRLVAIKVGILGVLALFGYFHKERMTPRLLRGDEGGPRVFRRALQGEAIFMVLVLTAAGILAASPPPDKAVETGGGTAPAFLEFQKFSQKTHVILQVRPNPPTVGVQRVNVILHPIDQAEIPNSTRVDLKIGPDADGEPDLLLEPPPQKISPNEWTTEESGFFTSPGTWRVYVLIQRPDEFAKVLFTVNVTNPEAP